MGRPTGNGGIADRVLRTTPVNFPTLRVFSFTPLEVDAERASSISADFLRDFSPQTKVLRTWLKIPPVLTLK